MVDTFSDQFGGLDFKRSQHGSGMSGRSQPKKFIAALQRISDQTYNSIFTIQQMQQIAKVNNSYANVCKSSIFNSVIIIVYQSFNSS